MKHRPIALARLRKNLWWSAAAAAASLLLWAIVLWPAFAHARPVSKEQALLNQMLDKRHPDGKGPSGSSRSRGYYKGGNGHWKSR